MGTSCVHSRISGRTLGAQLNTTTFSPYRDARINRSVPSQHGGYPVYHSALGAFDQSTDVAWRIIKHILAGIEFLFNPENQYTNDLAQIVRAEFFWSRNANGRRGVVLYDNQGRAVMHVIHALLGYGGSGPQLTWHILETLGVSQEMFNEANMSVVNEEYVLVFSREEVSNDIVVLYGTPRDTWEWWRAQ